MIPARLIVVEIISGALFALVYVKYGLGAEFAIVGAAVWLFLAIALIDLERGLILNRIVYPSLVVFLVVAPFWSELGISRPLLGNHGMLGAFLSSLLAGVGAFTAFLIVTLLFPQGMGGGDVKLAGLIGLVVGFPGVLAAMWVGVVSGGVVAISLMILRRKGRKDAIPFGPFLSLGTIFVLLTGDYTISRYHEVAAKVTELWT